jgi:hypothetical protein
MNKIKIILLFALSCNFCFHAHSQHRIWFSELGFNILAEQKITYKGGNLTNTPAFGFSANINNGGRNVAFGLQFDYSPVHLKNVNTQPAQDNSLHLWEFYFGMRYYPVIPTMRLGTKGAIRFTAGGMIGGYDFYWRENNSYGNNLKWSPMQTTTVVFAGLCFSSFKNASGLSVKLSYKPQTYSMVDNFALKNFSLKQPFSIGINLIIGPKIRS